VGVEGSGEHFFATVEFEVSALAGEGTFGDFECALDVSSAETSVTEALGAFFFAIKESWALLAGSGGVHIENLELNLAGKSGSCVRGKSFVFHVAGPILCYLTREAEFLRLGRWRTESMRFSLPWEMTCTLLRQSSSFTKQLLGSNAD
jgi:hypothetical protein